MSGTIAQGPRVELAYVAETVRGTTPTTPSTKLIRSLTRNINFKKRTFESQEIQANREIVDFRHGFQTAEGSIGIELSRTTYDDWLEALLGGTWTSNVLKCGTNLKTFTIERRFLDIAKYQTFTGVAINALDLRVTPEQIVGGTFNVLGMIPNGLSGTSVDASPDPNTTTAPFDAFNGDIQENGVSIATVTGMTLNITNGRQLTGVVGQLTSPDVFDGRIRVAGTVDIFLENGTLFDKFKNETETSLKLVFDDLDGTNHLTIDLSRVKLNGNDIDPPPEGGVVQNIPFAALHHATDSTIKITRT